MNLQQQATVAVVTVNAACLWTSLFKSLANSNLQICDGCHLYLCTSIFASHEPNLLQI